MNEFESVLGFNKISIRIRIRIPFSNLILKSYVLVENKLYSQHFGVKSWIFFIIGISIVYVKIKPYTKFDAKLLIRSKVMID